MRSSQRARRRWRISRSASWVPGPPVAVLVANAVMRCPTTSGDGQLRAGVGPFLAHDHPHALGPPGQFQQVGELGDPRTVANLVVRVQRRRPHVIGDVFEQVSGVRRQGKPHRVRQSLGGHPVQDRVGRARAVDPDQHLAPRAGPGPVARELGEGALDDGDVIGGGVRPGVRPGVAGAEQHRQRFPGPGGPVVDEREQRVEAETALFSALDRSAVRADRAGDHIFLLVATVRPAICGKVGRPRFVAVLS